MASRKRWIAVGTKHGFVLVLEKMQFSRFCKGIIYAHSLVRPQDICGIHAESRFLNLNAMKLLKRRVAVGEALAVLDRRGFARLEGVIENELVEKGP